MDESKCWNELTRLSNLYLIINVDTTMLIGKVSIIIIRLVTEYDIPLSIIEMELRRRELNLWIFAEIPHRNYTCRNIQSPDKVAAYAMSICFGNKSYFEQNDLKRICLTYEENFASTANIYYV